MKRLYSLLLLLLIFPGLAQALGLGNLELKSALNEPFSANIDLLSATAEELDSLKVELADSDAFARANIERPFILSQLRFKLIRLETGDDYISVSSQGAIREPFLNFLVEVSWSNGRLFREYTVFLDPPTYDPAVNVEEIMALKPAAPEAAATPVDPDHQVVYADDFESYASGAAATTSVPVSSSISYGGGDYGPTTASDTLWSIASAMRPDASVSVNQMMLALVKANPNAFVDNNINGLKRGQILKMPSEAEINAMSSRDALAEVKNQYAAWERIKTRLGTSVAERPETSSTPEADTGIEAAGTPSDVTDAELKLVAAGDKPESSQQAPPTDGGASAELVLAQENIQALTQENLELQDQLKENESIINDLKRLLELKDDELATLQAQLAEQDVAPTVTETVEETATEATKAAEETVADVEEVVEEPVSEVVETTEEVIETIEDTAPAVEVEETIEVIDTEPETSDAGIMAMVQNYLGPLTDMLGGNPLYAIAALGLLVVLILIAVAMKLKKKPATEKSAETSGTAADEFPEFDTGDSDLDVAEQELESEATTVLPGSEDETVLPGEESEVAESEDETYLPGGPDEEAEAPAAPTEEPAAPEMDEDQEEDDPLQEVNTYLAFEQFDQAEEFVRNAINDKPDNPEYHTKLLEVFYTSGNKKAYEEEAKELRELTGGDGEHWDMAVAMWSEMSPNRALFEEGADDEEDESSDTTGGFVDVTADVDNADDNALDFDLGSGEEESAEEDTLADEGTLDVAAAGQDEDILDVTAAVGLDDAEVDTSAKEEESLDISESSDSEDLLDVTAVGSSDDEFDEDLLDVSSGGNSGEEKLESTSAESDNEDMLDVTASSDMDLDSDEDLLDVNAATGAGADSDELLDLDIPDTVADTEQEDSEDDNVIDFDLATPAEEDTDEEKTEDISLDMGDAGEADATPEDEGLELDFNDSDSGDDDASLELSLDEPDDSDSADDGLELDLSEADSSDEKDEPIRLDMDLEDDASGAAEESGDNEHTVFVPRASQADEQSAEDEIATKLDLAKAYVELGDKDSAKTILDEVMADGNEEQKQQAEDLLGQV